MEKLLFPVFTAIFLFFFLLIFQPFGVNNYDPQERLGTMFLLGISVFCTAALLALLCNELLLGKVKIIGRLRNYILSWYIWSSIWLSFIMYITYNYLGGWHDFGFLSFLDFTKNVALLFFLPYVSFIMYTRFRDLNRNLNYFYYFNEYNEENEKIIHIHSENQSEHFSIRIDSVLFISSEDNYISIYFLQSGDVKRKLLRKSLKSMMEEQHHPLLIRCHRSYAINLMHLKQMKGNKSKMELFIDHITHGIPVSRQYTEAVKDKIQTSSLSVHQK